MGLGVLDNTTLICWCMLFICGFTVLPFVFHYMGSFISGWNLYFLILCFIKVMAFLMFRGDFLFSLVAWEYLGLARYLLILFLCNETSVHASLVTVFASRFGDVALFVIVGLGLFGCSYSFFYGFLLLLVVLTKSACFPFSSWLLEAMRAPTPVSCLVHSSTLVAAGVWFSLRYNSFFPDRTMEILCLTGLYTILVTAISALFLTDLKKLVALSTCNKISWCLVCFSLGDLTTCILFLITHGVSKCLLFVMVGDLMSSSSSSQRGVGVYFCRYSGRFSTLISVILLSCLSGLPFMGVFLSKHVLLEGSGLRFNPGFYILCCFCVSLSFAYTYRFAFLMLNRVGGLSRGLLRDFFLYSFIAFLPCILGFIGSGLGALPDRFFFYPSVVSLFAFIHFFGLGVGVYCYFGLSSLFFSTLWSYSLGGCDFFVGLFYSLGFYLSSFFYYCCYRWEVFVLYFIRGSYGGFSLYMLPFLGINLTILGLLWCARLLFIF